MTGRSRWTAPLAAIAGLGVWALYFVVIYGLFSIGCERRWRLAEPDGLDRLSLVLILTAVPFLGLLLWLTIASLRRWLRARVEALSRIPGAEEEHFIAMTAFWLNLLALVAALWVSLPLLLTTPC
jgi:NO-binding membrane sensor protein with MHYT domain